MTLTTAPRQTIIVAGLGYGDESKGATVDYLAAALPDVVAVVRWSGGAQAAHNVRHGHRHHTFSQFGSGTFCDVRTILRAPMLVNPILLVAEAGQTRRTAARQAVERLQQLGVNVVGVVLNRVRPRRAKGYGYYQYYGAHEKQ